MGYFRSFFLVRMATATAHRLTTPTAAAEKIAALVNSGTVGLGEDPYDGDDVGFDEVDGLDESEMTSIAVDPAPNILPAPES